MNIRNVRLEDIPAILKLERQAPELAHWSERSYRAAFDPGAPDRVILAGEIEGAVESFLIARFAPGECELENIMVAPGYRRRRVATSLLMALVPGARERGAKQILLEVRKSNAAARSFYLKHGFREVGLRKNYYTNPEEDAVLYSLSL